MKDVINYFTSLAEVPVWVFFFVGLSWIVSIIALFIKTDAIDDLRREINRQEEDLNYFIDGNERLIYQVRKKEDLLKAAQVELRELRNIATRPSRVIEEKSPEEKILEHKYKASKQKETSAINSKHMDVVVDKIAKKF